MLHHKWISREPDCVEVVDRMVSRINEKLSLSPKRVRCDLKSTDAVMAIREAGISTGENDYIWVSKLRDKLQTNSAVCEFVEFIGQHSETVRLKFPDINAKKVTARYVFSTIKDWFDFGVPTKDELLAQGSRHLNRNTTSEAYGEVERDSRLD